MLFASSRAPDTEYVFVLLPGINNNQIQPEYGDEQTDAGRDG